MPDTALPFAAPRRIILDHPTPFRRLRNLERIVGRAGLFIKRDDHMEIALGGNKLRSLEFWLGAATQAGADVLLVAGGPMSNLTRLTAAAAAMYGFECIVLHNCEASDSVRQKSFLNTVFGAEVRFLGDIGEEQRAQAAIDAAAQLRGAGRTPYIVGDPIIGAMGYVVAAFELHAQAQAEGVALRHVFLSGSMGPTEAGFVFGNALLGNPFTVHLVSVEYQQAELAARVAALYDGLERAAGPAAPGVAELPIRYHMDQLGDGYGRPTAAAERALLMLARSEGILTEHVYTAKTLAGFIELARNGGVPAEEAACFFHTGGVPSLFSQFDLFHSLPMDASARARPTPRDSF